jgi:uncharacterized membrane protein
LLTDGQQAQEERMMHDDDMRYGTGEGAPPEPEESPYATHTAQPLSISRIEFERIFGGHVLAWVGGLATAVGLVFFMRMAIDGGWLTEQIRTVMAAVGSFSLLLAGIWMHERKGYIEVARAAVAAAITGLYATAVVATQTYDLISPVLGLEAAALIGAVGVFIAVRWSSMLVAGMGVLGALGAPLLVGTATDGGSIAFVAVALAASVGVLLWQRWNWLALGAFAVSAPQLAIWVSENHTAEPTLLVLATLVGFWGLYVAAAFGYELRTRDESSLSYPSWLLLLASSTLIVGLGCFVLDRAGDQVGLNAWIFGFAGAHLVLGELARRFGLHREVGSLLIAGGIGLGTFGCANAFDGPTVVAAWSAAAAALAFLATRVDASRAPALSDAERLLLAAGTFLGLAIGHVLLVEAPPSAIVDGVTDLGSSLVAIACCAGAALACHRFGRQIVPAGATAAGFVGAASLVYLGSVLIIDVIGADGTGEAREIGQAWLSAFWAATGLGAVVWGLIRKSPNVRLGGLALLALAIGKVWTYDLSELEELPRALSFVALGLLLLLGAFAYQRIKPEEVEAEERESEPASV